MVALPGNLFYGVAIPCCLWFFAKNKNTPLKLLAYAAKAAAFSQQAHCLVDPHSNLTIDVCTVADSCTMTPRLLLQYMGYSMRTAA